MYVLGTISGKKNAMFELLIFIELFKLSIILVIVVNILNTRFASISLLQR